MLILTGGLGWAKLTLPRAFRALGDGHMVTSPTFALMAVHDQGRIPLFHFDLYRLEHAYELRIRAFSMCWAMRVLACWNGANNSKTS